MSALPAVAPSVYSYEVTFGLGTLGINLQTTRCGKGVYVDSFYRPGGDTILPAEQYMINQINGEDVSELNLEAIPKIIEKSKRPITIKFERYQSDITFHDVVCDPRKLPWFMQYLVEKYGIEDAVQEQAKLMLWLECDQYLENLKSIPDGNYLDIASMILKKFFKPDSNFSLLLLVPEKIRSAMLIALSNIELHCSSTPLSSSFSTQSSAASASHISPSQTLSYSTSQQTSTSPPGIYMHPFQDAQNWAEIEMRQESFKSFSSSTTAARMKTHLRQSPPFVKVTLRDVLTCDRKSMFLLVYMCRIKRQSVFHCHNLLKNRPEDFFNDSAKSVENMLRIAVSCVQVLGLQVDRCGIEDLTMLNQLKEILPPVIELPAILQSPSSLIIPGSSGTNLNTVNYESFIEQLQSAMCLSIPVTETIQVLRRDNAYVSEVRKCLHELRLAMLRELTSEIMPKFLESKEFEILLWELDAHLQYVLSASSTKSRNEEGETCSIDSGSDDDLVFSLNLSLSSLNDASLSPSAPAKDNKKIVAEVPDGAVQRLLRKVDLPNKITMHRSPLDLMNDLLVEKATIEKEPVAWLASFSTAGGRTNFEWREGDSSNSVYSATSPNTGSEAVVIDQIIPVYPNPTSSSAMDTPFDYSNSIIPDSISKFLVSNGVCVFDKYVPIPKVVSSTISTRDNSILYLSTLTLSRSFNMKVKRNLHSKSDHMKSDTTTKRPPKTPKSSFVSIANSEQPTQSDASNSYGKWMNHVSNGIETSLKKAQSSPFLDRFKGGLSTPKANNNDSVHIGASSKNNFTDNLTESNSTSEGALVDSSVIRADLVGTSTKVNTIIDTVALEALHGFCLITRVPCMNALRYPLLTLMADSNRMKEISCSNVTDSSSAFQRDGNIRLQRAMEYLEEDKGLNALRIKSSKFRISMKLPSVLRPDAAYDFDVEMVLRALNPRNFVTILIAFILEHKIVVISSRLTLLTAFGELLKLIISPMRWSHIYIPIVPVELSSQLLQCPTPFFVGMHREYFDGSVVSPDICLVDMDNDIIRTPQELGKAPLAGRRLARSLDRILRPALYHCDDAILEPSIFEALTYDSKNFSIELSPICASVGMVLSREIIRLCKLFVADILLGVEECCAYAIDHNEVVIAFDETMFAGFKQYRSKDSTFPYESEFIDQLMRTQCFSLCVAGAILKKQKPESRPPSRPSSPFISIPSHSPISSNFTSCSPSALPTTPVHIS